MLNLDFFPEFKSDIQGNATNIHPIVKINTNPPIYLSQNAEVIDDGGVPKNFQALNLKIPSIKESIDIENRNFKINNITLTISNKDYIDNNGSKTLFSDLFSTRNFLNISVEIYWKSQSCKTLEQCLPVYTAIIKRVSHDYNNVKIILEDLTESVMHRKIPIGILNSENALRDEDVNKTIPMVYGEVDKAPCVLYKDLDQDTETLKKIYTLADRYEVSLHRGVVDVNDGYNPNAAGTNTGSTDLLYVYSGSYLKVMENIAEHDNLDSSISLGAPSFPQLQVETENTENNGTRTFLRSTFQSLTTTNTISLGIMQVLFNRTATTFSVLNHQQPWSYEEYGFPNTPNIAMNWAEESIGIPQNAIDNSWTTYSEVPSKSLSSYESLMTTEDGWFSLSSFYNGRNISTRYNDNETFSLDAFSGDWDESSMEISNNNKYWHIHRNVNRDLGQSLAGKVEFICLPDAKKLYDLFYEWYNNLALEENPSGHNLRAWQSNAIKDVNSNNRFKENHFNHMWGTALDFQSTEYDEFGLPPLGFLHSMTDFSNPSDEGLNYPYDSMVSDVGTGLNASDASLPNYLYKIAKNLEIDSLDNLEYLTTNPNAWVLFSKDFDGNDISGYNKQNLPHYNETGNLKAIHIDFWDLLSYHEILYEDLPRYRVTGLIDRNMYYNGNPYDINHFYDNLSVEWNGISENFWVNTGQRSGFPYPWNAQREQSEINSIGYNGTDDSVDWNNFFSDSQWHIHFLEDVTLEGSGITIKKGTMMPGCMGMPIFKSLEDYDGSPIDYQNSNGIRTIAKNKIPGNINFNLGEQDTAWIINTGAETGSGLSADIGGDFADALQNFQAEGEAKGLGLLMTLNDSSVDNAIEESGFAYFYGKVDAHIYWTGLGGGGIDSTYQYLQMRQYAVDVPTSEEQTEGAEIEAFPLCTLSEIVGSDVLGTWGVEGHPYYDQFVNNNYKTMYDSQLQSLGDDIFEQFPLHSSIWDIPNRFNAAMVGFHFRFLNYEGAALLKTRVHNMGMKHIFEIDDIFAKDYYLETKGRICGSSDSPELESPPTAVMKDIIETELNQNINVHPSYLEVDSNLSYGNWSIAFSQTEQIEAKKIIQEIAKSTPVIPLFRSNLSLGMALIKNDYSDSDISSGGIIKTSDIISSSLDRTKIENVKTIVSVKHSKDYAEDKYLQTSYVSAYDFYGNGDRGYPNGYKKSFYGLNADTPGDSVLEFVSDYTRYKQGYTGDGYFGNSTPEKLRDFLLAYNCNQHNIIKFKTTIKYAYLEVTDIIRFDSLINGMKCFGEDYTQSGVIRNGQEIYPYFMITNITKDINSINVECIQMHNLERNNEVLIQGNGDFNLSGAADEQDIHELKSYILNPYQYITEGQKYACDLNNDGKLDESDLSILTESLQEPLNILTINDLPEYSVSIRENGQIWVNIPEVIRQVTIVCPNELLMGNGYSEIWASSIEVDAGGSVIGDFNYQPGNLEDNPMLVDLPLPSSSLNYFIFNLTAMFITGFWENSGILIDLNSPNPLTYTYTSFQYVDPLLINCPLVLRFEKADYTYIDYHLHSSDNQKYNLYYESFLVNEPVTWDL